MLSNKINIYKFLPLTFCAAYLFTGCVDNVSPEEKDPFAEQTIQIGGKVTSPLNTRTYVASGPVSEGQYYLTYNSTNSTEQVATVNFGYPSSPTTGIVTTPDNDELRWDMVGGTGNTIMFLDNVKGYGATTVNSTTINFNDAYNPFKAAPFDSINGTNDLLWGSTEAVRGSKKINFPLYHNMARFRIMITADASNEVFGGEVGLDENATVVLTSVGQNPESYNRLTGELFLGEEPVYTDLTLVDNTENGNLDWHFSYYPETSNPAVKTYVTSDFVLPPQLLQDDDNRPRLVITTKAGKVFSGILPHAMQVEYADQEEPYPVAMAFLRQHIVTIYTEISQNPPELIFMPVKVIDWVDKGEWILEGHQAGLYLTSDFMDLLAYYADGNLYQLARYGFPDEDGFWTFNFWRGTVLKFSDIANKMPVNAMPTGMTGFEFVFNGYGQNVQLNDGTIIPVTAQQLYQIVTQGTYTN